MSGLVLKDLLSLRRYLKSIVIFLLIYDIIFIVVDQASSAIGVTIFILANLHVSASAYDESSRWDSYAQSLPLSHPQIVGVHDMVIHDYGRSKLFATVHVEVDANMPIMAAHDLADALEKQIGKEMDIALTVHIDPLVFDDPKVNKFRAEAARVVAAVDPHFAMHDFRVVGGKTHSNLVFDVAVPFDCKLSDAEIERRIRDGISLSDENLDAVVTVERQ